MPPPNGFIPIPPDGKLETSSGAYIGNKREAARYRIGFSYVIGFIVMLLYAMTLFLLGKMELDGLVKLLTTISGTLSGPLGFIIAFYYKSQVDQNN